MTVAIEKSFTRGYIRQRNSFKFLIDYYYDNLT